MWSVSMFAAKCFCIALLFAATTASLAAQDKPAPPVATSPPSQGASHPLSATEAREAQLVADTEKLYQLAQELKAELDKSTKDTLSLTVVKKAAEIERLAHSISERMKSR